MLLIACPWCGPRPEPEFVYAGEAHRPRPAPAARLSDEEWAGYLYRRANTCGPLAERWRHTHGCGCLFHALRDTRSDRFIATYRLDEAPPAAREPSG
jgi:sarcosine oxidase subunit delta